MNHYERNGTNPNFVEPTWQIGKEPLKSTTKEASGMMDLINTIHMRIDGINDRTNELLEKLSAVVLPDEQVEKKQDVPHLAGSTLRYGLSELLDRLNKHCYLLERTIKRIDL